MVGLGDAAFVLAAVVGILLSLDTTDKVKLEFSFSEPVDPSGYANGHAPRPEERVPPRRGPLHALAAGLGEHAEARAEVRDAGPRAALRDDAYRRAGLACRLGGAIGQPRLLRELGYGPYAGVPCAEKT